MADASLRAKVLSLVSATARVLSPARVEALSRTRFGSVLRSLINRAAPSGPVEVAIAAGPLKGARMRLDLRAEKYYWLGAYEPDTVATIQEMCEKGDVVYDIGANLGYTALLFAKAVGKEGVVVAFEPLPENATRVEEHIAMNQVGARVTVEAMAISDATGTERFLVHELHGMGKIEGSSGRKEGYADVVEVPAISVDDYVFGRGGPTPAVIKLDIEGGGGKAISGMARVLADVRPVVLAELHGAEERDAVVGALRAHRYDLREMRRGLPKWTDAMNKGWKSHVAGIPGEKRG